ncbi:AAA family ATPase [Paenibacillus hamazuiensis]|uniref:AAA family ATPase n=1 Tax=Paenibacillus hamazuiensis TaxID=2936508 RepID=UPI00200BC66C|nr:AAA family ATPase [Paenibacillus hamazuiensis]
MAHCCFQLLGSLKITFDGEDLTLAVPGGKAKLLLAYCILSSDVPLSRKQIAFDFWPDTTEKQALTNLRKLLHDLRENVPQIERCLKITSACIQWNDEIGLRSDVREFERMAQGQTVYELSQAEELYKGRLLPGFYAEWLDARRELLEQTYLGVLDRLIAILESRREYAAALCFANKLLIQNKFREETYRTLMRLHALNHDMAGAALVFRQMHRTWQDELGLSPAEETVQLLEKLSTGGGESSTGAQTGLIGRIAEWQFLWSAWKQAAAGESAMLILKGEAGIGKTRLAQEFRMAAESGGHRTAFAGCYPSVSALSYRPITDWLRCLRMPPLSPVWLSELARLLPELLEQYPGLPQPSPIQEKWQLGRWYEAIERVLAASGPLLLILDDLQWCDGETLQLLSFLLRSDSRSGFLVIATMRTEEDPGESFEPFAAGLRDARKLAEIELAPLSEEETKRLAAAAVGEELASRHATGLYAETGGNPLFIVETLREWQTAGGGGEFRLSPLVDTVIENRIGKLPAICRMVASAIAAVGRPVPPALMAMVMKMDEDEIIEPIGHLVQVKILQEGRDGKYDFTHDRLREAAYKLMNESGRRRCHRRIADGLSAVHPGQSEAAAEIAFHYEHAGMAKEAAEHYEAAAKAAEEIYANETRIRYYRKLCALLPPGQTLPILMKLGDALIMTGDWSEAENTYRRWLERSGASADIRERSLCDVALGNCLRLQGKYEEAGFHLERALRCFEMLEDTSGLRFVYVTLGILHYYRGNFAKVLDISKRIATLPDDGRSTRDDCRFYGILGHLHYDQCEYEQAIHWIKKQIGLASEIRDKYSVEQAMGVLAMVYMDIDEMDRAFDLLVDKMEISKSIGDRMGFANALGMLGKHYWYLGHYAHAAPCIIFCLEEAVAIKDWRIAAIMLSFEGRNLLAEQRLEEAELPLERSIRLFRLLDTPYFACETLYFMSLLKQRRQQYESAMESAEEALRMADRLQRKDMQASLRTLLLQLRTELRWLSPGAAAAELENMLTQYPRGPEQAAIRFALWRLNPDSSECRVNAAALNRALYRKSGKRQYLDRCRELDGFSHAAEARRLPQIAAEAAGRSKVSAQALEEIDRYLNR